MNWFSDSLYLLCGFYTTIQSLKCLYLLVSARLADPWSWTFVVLQKVIALINVWIIMIIIKVKLLKWLWLNIKILRKNTIKTLNLIILSYIINYLSNYLQIFHWSGNTKSPLSQQLVKMYIYIIIFGKYKIFSHLSDVEIVVFEAIAVYSENNKLNILFTLTEIEN